MSTATLNIDPSATLNVEGIWTGHSFEFLLEQFEDDGTTPLPYSGTYKYCIYSDPERTKKVMELVVGNGLAVSGNQMTVRRSISDNKLKPGTYYTSLDNDIDSNNSYPPVHGTWKVKKGR